MLIYDPFIVDKSLQRRNQILQVPQKDPMRVTSPELMQKIRDVIVQTTTPSWVNSVPFKFGEASAGSLKADEWRTLGTIYFPLAMVSLWGQGSVHKSAERAAKLRNVLDLTMSLVSAVIVACKRTVTKERQEAYGRHISNYTQRLSELYPDFEHRPNNHVAFHIYDFLALFGPVHSWWTFPFERLIGQLQRMPSNHKFGTRVHNSCFHALNLYLGQLEFTMLQSFTRAGKLRRWLSRPDCPEAVKECKALFDKSYPQNVDTNGIGDVDDEMATYVLEVQKKPQTTPADLLLLTGSQRVVLHARFKSLGVVYTRSSTHLGNSLICFYPLGDISSPPIPGSIKYIFSSGDEIIFAVQRQLPCVVGDLVVDPYAPYPNFGAKLYQSRLGDLLEKVKVDWISCHFARWNMTPKYAVVLPLSKASIRGLDPH